MKNASVYVLEFASSVCNKELAIIAINESWKGQTFSVPCTHTHQYTWNSIAISLRGIIKISCNELRS